MNIDVAKRILRKYGLESDLGSSYSAYRDIERIGDPLTDDEHLILFDTMWFLGNRKRGSNVSISTPLKLKLIRKRKRLGRYDMVARGHIEGGNINGIIKDGKLNGHEEAEVWSIFHKLWHHDSARDSDEINKILGTYRIVERKIKFFGRINVLDIGCGINGNGISTLTAKYAGKVRGFGVDLDVQKNPSNVKLVIASADRLPFRANFFEVIYSSNVIYYFKGNKIIDVMREVLRVLKPRGMLVFDDNSRGVRDYKEEIIPTTGVRAKIQKYGSAILIIKY